MATLSIDEINSKNFIKTYNKPDIFTSDTSIPVCSQKIVVEQTLPNISTKTPRAQRSERFSLCSQKSPTSLILSGNATNAVLVLGALQYIHETQCDLTTISHYGATSSGAMISILLMLNYEPIEILMYLCTSKLYNNLYLNFSSGMTGKPLSDFNEIEQALNILIKKKWVNYINHKHAHFVNENLQSTNTDTNMDIDGVFQDIYLKYFKECSGPNEARLEYYKIVENTRTRIPTLKEFEIITNKTFICTTYNLTDDIREYITSTSHPDVLITDALKMTCAVPFLFGPCLINKKYYLDGGMFDNLPLSYMMNKYPNNNNYAVFTSASKKPYSPDQPFSEYLWKLFNIFKSTTSARAIHSGNFNSTSTATTTTAMDAVHETGTYACNDNKIIEIIFDGGYLTFESSNTDLIHFFDSGYMLCKSYIAK